MSSTAKYSEEQQMLMLAALAYRGFQDILMGAFHQEILREALLDGLNAFAPARDWELVWGPAATRQVPLKMFRSFAVFDWNAMYVVRHRTDRHKYVIAIRGTNPISARDWLFGDLWVSTKVPWPYGNGTGSISTSTALGLSALQSMGSDSATGVDAVVHVIAGKTRDLLHAIARDGERLLRNLPGHRDSDEEKRSHVEQQINALVEYWMKRQPDRNAAWASLQQSAGKALVQPQELRPQLAAKPLRDGSLDLLNFLRTQTGNAGKDSPPLEVTVTGHSKGGALAPVVALWLREALGAGATECWDETGRATISFYAFAGPTPGDETFAGYMDEKLGQNSHYMRNRKDVVPHAFQVTCLEKIPALYKERTADLDPLVKDLIRGVQDMRYAHSNSGVTTFDGDLKPSRKLAVELVHQHLDAYLAHAGLLSDDLNSFTCFV